MRRIADYGTYSKTLEQRRSESKDGYVPVHRVGQVEDFREWGLFFAFDLDYFDQSMTSYKRTEAVEYLLDLNAKIWDPVTELNLEVDSWSAIYGLTTDFDKYRIAENDEYEAIEGYSVTTTDDLASAGKRLGYQAVYLTGIPGGAGWGDNFDEIAVFDKSIIERI